VDKAASFVTVLMIGTVSQPEYIIILSLIVLRLQLTILKFSDFLSYNSTLIYLYIL
jgi:hypothetical protein